MEAEDDHQRVKDDGMFELHHGVTMVEGRSQDGLCVLAMDHEEEEENEEEESSTSSVSVGTSSCSIGSSDIEEDASSSSSSSSMLKYSSSSNSSSSGSLSNNRQGPLYELSELMSQLPIKRGLSKFYDGRSQSYTSLASVKSVDDLRKKEIIISSNRKRLKLCKSYAGGLDKSAMSPKATIAKRSSLSSSSFGRKSYLGIANRPPVPVLRT